MRFDDTLETVLAADLSTPYGVQSAWRQLVDLIGRRRAPPESRALALLRSLRDKVPAAVRAASARALEFADPPAPLVWIFATDDLPSALPVLRSARLHAAEWIQLLPDLAPAGRAVLRNRRDLNPSVKRALESFGPVDFVLPDASGTASDFTLQVVADAADPTQAAPMDQVEATVVADAEMASEAAAVPEGEGPFEIADVVARIDAFWRHREEAGPVVPVARVADEFRFETDAKGAIRWVEGVNRAALVGLGFGAEALPGGSRVDGAAAGAFRRRAGFADARLWVSGDSDAAGDWLISGLPVFDSLSGRFTGYRGTARRPRSDERADPVRPTANPAESLRQLVHELRTPTNAIAGFAEMIETQMLGPVSAVYRGRAGVIRTQARELLGAIDDLDLAARIDSAALALTTGHVALRPLLAGIAEDLATLAELRGSFIALPDTDVGVMGDRRAVERLLARLLATLVSASSAGERIGVHVAADSNGLATIAIDRPRALADYPGESVLGIDDEAEDTSLLGTGFALRLSRNLARELGGSLKITAERLTLQLPAAVTSSVGQAHLS